MNSKQIYIQTRPIRLGQFLKFADMVQDGVQAKIVIANEEVTVNGKIETRRGKQLGQADIVQYRDHSCKVQYLSPPSAFDKP